MQYLEIDFKELDALLHFKANKRQCANYLEVSEDTLERRIKEKFNKTFSEYADIKLDNTRIKLQQKIIQKALKGDNTCLIFSLKNLCKWTDKQEVSIGEDSGPLEITLKYNLDE